MRAIYIPSTDEEFDLLIEKFGIEDLKKNLDAISTIKVQETIEIKPENIIIEVQKETKPKKEPILRIPGTSEISPLSKKNFDIIVKTKMPNYGGHFYNVLVWITRKMCILRNTNYEDACKEWNLKYPEHAVKQYDTFRNWAVEHFPGTDIPTTI